MAAIAKACTVALLLGMLFMADAQAPAPMTPAQLKKQLESMTKLVATLCADPSSPKCTQLLKLGSTTCAKQPKVCAGVVPSICSRPDWKKRCSVLAPKFCAAQKSNKPLYTYCMKVAQPYIQNKRVSPKAG